MHKLLHRDANLQRAIPLQDLAASLEVKGSIAEPEAEAEAEAEAAAGSVESLEDLYFECGASR
jgi:hypothetical protein